MKKNSPLFFIVLLLSSTSIAQNQIAIPQMLDSINIRSTLTNRQTAQYIVTIPITSLQQSGQQNLDKMLQYTVPSFNTRMNITISDPTIGYDPSGLRGLGSSRSLVLINGKRKNLSSLVFTTTHGNGEVGYDLSNIPTNMIESVQILGNNASTIYGSDAMAGVINVVLKKTIGQSIEVNTGITAKGDGTHIGYNYTGGFNFFKKGFILIAHSFDINQRINRAGSNLLQDQYFGVLQGSATYMQYEAFFKKYHDLGQIYGQPNSINTNIGYNMGYNFNTNANLYSFSTFNYHIAQTYGLYIPPYVRPNDYGLLHKPNTPYYGYGPKIVQQLFDYNINVGMRGGDRKKTLYYDAAIAYSNNPIQNSIYNTINFSMKDLSPTRFFNGSFHLTRTLVSLDISRDFLDRIFLQMGTYFNYEQYRINKGNSASFSGSGSAGLPGIKNSIFNSRYNTGVYAQAGWLVFKPWYIEAAVRLENYQHIPYNISWNANTKISLWEDKLQLRGSISTGFRAPSLQQSALMLNQAIALNNQLVTATILNNANAMQFLGIPLLKHETSFNYSAGFQITPIKNLNISATYFNTTIYNRILFSEYIDSVKNNTPQILSLMRQLGVGGIKFFINGATTNTQGVEMNIEYNNLQIATHHNIDILLSGTLRWNQLVGNFQTPQHLAQQGIQLFSRKTRSYLFESQPNQKCILNIIYHYKNFSTGIANTYFGAVYYRDLVNPAMDQKFTGKIITDIHVAYSIHNRWKLFLSVNNLFNIYPDTVKSNILALNFGGRLPYSWEQNQFGFWGTTFNAKASVSF